MSTPLGIVDAIDRPRERLLQLGGHALSGHELLSIVLGVGSRGASALTLARRVMAQVGGLSALAVVAPPELQQIPGIGSVRAVRVCAAVELGRRSVSREMISDAPVTGPEDIYRRLRVPLGELRQEVFILLALDARNRITQQLEIARGSLTGVDVHPREIFSQLIRSGAAAAVVAHNHPSGDPEPSPEDLKMTQRILAAGELLGIPILDHLVVTRNGYCSIAERLAP